MKTSSISFTSTLFLTNEKAFNKAIELPKVEMGKEELLSVKKPIIGCGDREFVTNEFAGMRRVYDCAGLGIVTQNGNPTKKATLYHFNPDWLENINFESLRGYILNNLPKDTPVSALIFGEKLEISPNSKILFDNVETIVKSLNIPYSKFEGIPIDDGANGYFDGVLDKWTLWFTDKHKDFDNGFLNKKSVFKRIKKIIISSTDTLV